MSYRAANDSDLYAPATPDIDSDDGSRLEELKTPHGNVSGNLSVSSFNKSYQPATIEDSIQESIQDSFQHLSQESIEESVHSDKTESSSKNSSHVSDLSSDNESYPEVDEDQVDKSKCVDHSVVSSKDHSNVSTSRKDPCGHAYNNIENSEEDASKDFNPDESYHIQKTRLSSEEYLENDPDPDESYQVFKAIRRKGHQVIRSSGENSAEVSDLEKSAPKSPSPIQFFKSMKKRLRVKNQISSSDEYDSDSESPQANMRTKPGLSRRHVESDDTEEETEARNIENEDTLEEPNEDPIENPANDDSDDEEEIDREPHLSTSAPTPRISQGVQQYGHDSGNGSSIEHVTREGSIGSSVAPDEITNQRRQIEDLDEVIEDTSILEVSSTIVSFSSPTSNEKEPDESIEEIASSPETPRVIAVVNHLSPAELMRMRQDLEQKQLLMKSCRLESLPDGGAKLKAQIRQLKEKLQSAESAPPSARTAPPHPSSSGLNNEVEEDELRKQLQMKKWAIGNANGLLRDRLRAEIGEMERRLIKLSIANATATNAKGASRPLGSTVSTSKPASINLLPDAPKLSDFRNELQQRMLAEQARSTKFIPEAPKLSEVQKQMFADHPGKELYKKTESGYISAAARREAVSVTLDSLENLHRSLASCPGESEREPTPSCLAVPLLTHQERALKWLLWRETQVPAGGILADDMGLGKTLTMISLIVRQKELDPAPPASTDIWLSKTVKIKRSSGTLVVCPASVVGQWENEIKRRCKRNALSVVIFHGPDRHKLAAKLHQYDIVITTYQIVSREISNVSIDKKDGDNRPIGDFDVETHAKEIRQSVLLQIAFNRVILDEAHVIRNPKSGVSQAVCRLRAARRWAVTGTPVQNKELDMYSLLRFLRVSPFDQLTVWKRWVDSSKAKNEQAVGRLQLLIKTLLLRRTKDQKGEGTDTPLVAMPERNVHTHQVHLSRDENEVYQKLLAFSRKALEDYIKSQEKRLRDEFTYDRSTLPEMPQKNVTKQMMLVLLLRLRQVCSHPALIKTMLDTTDSESMGSEDAKIEEDGNDMDLIAKMSTMTLGGNSEEPKKEEENFFTHTNPVFDQENMSSKMKYIIDEVKKVIDLGQKAVVVSQWTSMLDVFAKHFTKMRIHCHTIAGNVPLKVRTTIVEDFNTNPHGKPVILLSLGAGGVGLNLIGGNHLFLADMHWNPQLEAQACDRVYRVGQKNDVHIHRMVTVGTVEERILQLQQQKLAMANGILTGAAKLATKGLTIDDLKMLFNPGPPAYGPKPTTVEPY